MQSPEVAEAEVVRAVERSWTRETSYEPENWSSQNPAWEQCAVSALIVQDFLGGELLVGKVNGFEHYWNRLPDGRDLDLTKKQFNPIVSFEPTGLVDRDFVLSFPNTRKRYEKLRQSVICSVSNPSSAIPKPTTRGVVR